MTLIKTLFPGIDKNKLTTTVSEIPKILNPNYYIKYDNITVRFYEKNTNKWVGIVYYNK